MIKIEERDVLEGPVVGAVLTVYTLVPPGGFSQHLSSFSQSLWKQKDGEVVLEHQSLIVLLFKWPERRC